MTEKFVESLFGIKIFAAPFIVGVILGFICKIAIGGQTGNLLFAGMVFLGATAGFLLLKVIRRNTSFSEFESRINASPDLDEANDKKD